MIRINLSPKKLEKKKENLRLQVWVFLLSLAITLAACAFVYMSTRSGVQQLSLDRDAEQSRRAKFNAVLKTLKEQEEERQAIDKKVDDIRWLEGERRNPEDIMTFLRHAMSDARVFLVRINTERDSAVLEGYASDNATIADFISDLKSDDDLVASANLVRSRLRYVPVSWRSVQIRGQKEAGLTASETTGVRRATKRGRFSIQGIRENETIEAYFTRFDDQYSKARPKLAGYAKELEDEFARKLMKFTINLGLKNTVQTTVVTECEESEECKETDKSDKKK